MIELGLLGLLSDQELHGYELKKQLSELLGSWSSLSFGSLYPALGRLERAGLVEAVDSADLVEPSGPMTGALSGELAAFRNRLAARPARGAKSRGSGRRGKKVYRITPAGRARLVELLVEPGPDDDRSFALRVAFCRLLPPDERLALFERRKAEITGLLASRRRAGGRRTDLYRRSLRERDLRSLTADLAWLDELVAATRAEREAAPPAPAPGPSTPGPSTPALAPTGAAPRGVPSPSPMLAFPSLSTLTQGLHGTPLAEATKEGSV